MSEDEWEPVKFRALRAGDAVWVEHRTTGTTILREDLERPRRGLPTANPTTPGRSTDMSEDEWEPVTRVADLRVGRTIRATDLRAGDMIKAEHVDTRTTVRGAMKSHIASCIAIEGLGLSLRFGDWRFWRLRPSDLPEPIEPGTVVEAADHARYALLSHSLLSQVVGALEWWPISETHPKIIGEYCNWSHIEQPAKIIGRLRFESIGGES